MGSPPAQCQKKASDADYRHVGRAIRQSLDRTATIRSNFAALSAREKRRLLLELNKII